MSRLALLGGTPAVPRHLRQVEWPVIEEADRQAVLRALGGGKLVANAEGETEVVGLEREWAAEVGVGHCVAVANGTAALALALAAAGVEPGDEVIVPAFSFVATALAPLHQLAIPRFVDIDLETFNLDPALVEEAISERTRAILVVHLHGLPADMESLGAIARRRGVGLVEDAAQAHGATYRGRQVGALGDIAGFSLHVAKNLPTCGEGGLITTDDGELAARVRRMRQFGEEYVEGQPRLYLSQVLGWNYKLNPIQAAFSRSQLARFAAYRAARELHVRRFLAALETLPGIVTPGVPAGSTHAWHILRLRFDPVAAGLNSVERGPFRQALHRVLRAEGVPLSYYQVVPLPGQRIFQDRQGFGRGYPWAIAGGSAVRYRNEDFPRTLAVIEDSLTLQKRHLHPESGPLLELYADAFHKTWENLEVVARMARSMPYSPPWQRGVAMAEAGAAA